MFNFSNRTTLLTGGSRGIGAAAARLFAKMGSNIVITYRTDRKSALSLVDSIKSNGTSAVALKLEVENLKACERIVQRTIDHFGRIDILVNSAGIWEGAEIHRMKPSEWMKTININLTGTFNMCRAVTPVMISHRYGRIINISSTAGQRGEAKHSHYAASKGGVIAFTKSIAPELIRKGIWVNCVAPGWVDTDMVKSEIKNALARRRIEQSVPRGRVATAEEIAGPIVFLASAFADHIVGEILNVNGGSVLCG